MSAIDEDGFFPAMPITAGNQVYAQGLTLRDWFAGQALASIIRNSGRHYHNTDAEVRDCRLETATAAYGFADAMIAARKGGAA